MAEKPDINPTHLKIVTDILQKNLPQDVVVWTFGSRAKWTAKEFSDLDLALESKEDGKLPPDIIASLEDDFEESDLPWKVDVVDINAVAPSFKEIIIRDRVKLEDWKNRSNKTLGGGGMSSSKALKVETLETICELIVDCPHSTPKWTDNGYLVVKNQNIRDGQLKLDQKFYTDEEHFQHRIRRAKPQAGDLIFTREAPMGEICMVPDGIELCIGQRQVLLRVNKLVDPNYILYAMQSPFVRNQILWNEGTGSTVSNVRIPVLKKLEIPRLPQENQIGNILKQIDAKRQLNQRMNKTLEEMAQAIFKCWFVDFEPTRAKMAQKEGSGESNADICTRLKITTEILTFFPGTLTNSDLGPIPEGWEVSTIEDEVDIYGGSTPSTKNDIYWEGGTFYWSTPKDLSNITSPVLLDTDRKITEAGVNKITSGQLPQGTLLMSSRAPVGYLAIAEMPISINQGYIAMVCNKSLSNLFVLFWIKENMGMIKDHANGSTFQEISKKSFRPLPVLVPNNNVLTEFEFISRPIYENIVVNLRQNTSLAQIRDTLLPKLLSGEIAVGKIENIAGGKYE